MMEHLRVPGDMYVEYVRVLGPSGIADGGLNQVNVSMIAHLGVFVLQVARWYVALG